MKRTADPNAVMIRIDISETGYLHDLSVRDSPDGPLPVDKIAELLETLAVRLRSNKLKQHFADR